MSTKRLACWLALAGGWLVAGCDGGGTAPETRAPEPAAEARPAAEAPAAPEAATSTAAAAAEAKRTFETRCVTCHGATGAGDGPGSAALNPPPRDLRDVAWQRSVDDAHIEKIIQYGGAAVGRSPAMPGNPDLTAKPEVVAELRAYIRDLASP